MKNWLSITLVFFALNAIGQTTITFDEESNNKLYIKLYGHVDYNQKLESGVRNSGKMDVHRLVTLFGYQFSRNTQFVTEIEVEHVNEIFVEQAFVKHRLTKGISLKAGLILIPMGFINESHEPTFFYSVERPLLDNVIVPSTWREIGLGITGLIQEQNMRYQLYLVNNPLGYNNGPKINGSNGIRSARQKGAESVINSFPGISGQLEYFGWDGIKLGLSGYHGKTNTSLVDAYSNVINEEINAIIDSSTVNLSMLSVNATYNQGDFLFRGQYTFAAFGNSDQYNRFTGSDVAELAHGFYTLVAYDLIEDQKISLSPFFRYSLLNNHLTVGENIEKNAGLKQSIYTMGINYKPDPGVVFKMDFQFFDVGNDKNYKQFNMGVGVWF